MLEVTKENFESEVLQAEGYVFVDFFGDGCVPCAALMPHVHLSLIHISEPTRRS